MSYFMKQLKRVSANSENRKWLFVPYDQLTDKIGPLARHRPTEIGIVMVENPWKASLRPYHRQKLALILANMRHFALEQARKGVAVRYLVANGPYGETLSAVSRELGRLELMKPAERELRADLQPLVDDGRIKVVPHGGRLSSPDILKHVARPGPHWRMDAFYRRIRSKTGILIEGGRPVGGRFSYDTHNRLPWRGIPKAPDPCTFPIDPIKQEVGDLVRTFFASHPGKLRLETLPATKEDAITLWRWAEENCMSHFGPYEDAMSSQSLSLFHTRVSSLLNIHRLLPAKLVYDILAMDIPLKSKEGFVRQIIGWREFVYRVHEATDGFRSVGCSSLNVLKFPGDAGYNRLNRNSWSGPPVTGEFFGGACPSFLGAANPLPPAYWGVKSGLRCLDHIVDNVWDHGYSHHITRLMVLANIAALLDVSPRELTDWFWVAYTDAYDWVVEPNVLAMGTYALGPLMTTKPYVAGANYIHRMSDFCTMCRFDPTRTCPLNHLYWAFLARHKSRLNKNPRLSLAIKNLNKRRLTTVRQDRRVYEVILERLAAGEDIPTDVSTRGAS